MMLVMSSGECSLPSVSRPVPRAVDGLPVPTSAWRPFSTIPLRALSGCRHGGSAAEYALIIAVIATVLVVAVTALGTGFNNALGGSGNRIEAAFNG
jgi:Flp pilus assembly pilin Flp